MIVASKRSPFALSAMASGRGPSETNANSKPGGTKGERSAPNTVASGSRRSPTFKPAVDGSSSEGSISRCGLSAVDEPVKSDAGEEAQLTKKDPATMAMMSDTPPVTIAVPWRSHRRTFDPQ